MAQGEIETANQRLEWLRKQIDGQQNEFEQRSQIFKEFKKELDQTTEQKQKLTAQVELQRKDIINLNHLIREKMNEVKQLKVIIEESEMEKDVWQQEEQRFKTELKNKEKKILDL